MTENLCQTCGRVVTSTSHLDHPAYPAGDVLCSSCFTDALIARVTGLEILVTAACPPESVDIATATRTRLTEAGALVTTDWSAGVVWVVDEEPPDELKPYITAGWPRSTGEEVGDDD